MEKQNRGICCSLPPEEKNRTHMYGPENLYLASMNLDT